MADIRWRRPPVSLIATVVLASLLTWKAFSDGVWWAGALLLIATLWRAFVLVVASVESPAEEDV